MDNKKSIDKYEFINTLTSMTPEEMNEFIKNNGKGPKPIQLVTWLQSDNVENNIGLTEV